MAIYPTKVNDVVTLAEQMISGYTQYPDDFPSGNPDAIQTTLNALQQARDAQTAAEISTKTATEEKSGLLDSLNAMIKTSLKRAEADVAGHEDKLVEIGWGPRLTPQPVSVPGAPTTLCSIAEGQGSVALQWERPATGGPVRNYVIERCQQLAPGGDYGQWTIAGSTYNCDVTLANQPVDVKLMYAVKAVNNSGESAQSNIVIVTLP